MTEQPKFKKRQYLIVPHNRNRHIFSQSFHKSENPCYYR